MGLLGSSPDQEEQWRIPEVRWALGSPIACVVHMPRLAVVLMTGDPLSGSLRGCGIRGCCASQSRGPGSSHAESDFGLGIQTA